MTDKHARFWCEQQASSSQSIEKTARSILNQTLDKAGSLLFHDADPSYRTYVEVLGEHCADRLLAYQASWANMDSLSIDILREHNDDRPGGGFELRPVYEAFKMNGEAKPRDAELKKNCPSPVFSSPHSSQSCTDYVGRETSSISNHLKPRSEDTDGTLSEKITSISPVLCSSEGVDEVGSSKLQVGGGSEKTPPGKEDSASPMYPPPKVILRPTPIPQSFYSEIIHTPISLSSIDTPYTALYDCDQPVELTMCNLANTLSYLMNASYVKVYTFSSFSHSLQESVMFHVLNRHPMQWNIKGKNCYATEAIRKRRGLVIPDVKQVSEESPQGLGLGVDNVQSLLCFPIQSFHVSLHGLIELGRPHPLTWSSKDVNFVTILSEWLSISFHHSKGKQCHIPLFEIHAHARKLIDEYFQHENVRKSIEACLNFLKYVMHADQANCVVIHEGHIAVHYGPSADDPNRYEKIHVSDLGNIGDEDESFKEVSLKESENLLQPSDGTISEEISHSDLNLTPSSVQSTQDSLNSVKISVDSLIQESTSLHKLLNQNTSQTSIPNFDEKLSKSTKDIVEYIRRKKQCMLINNTTTLKDFLKPLTYSATGDTLVIESLLSIPLLSTSNSVLGLITIFNKEGSKFQTRDTQLITHFATYFTLIVSHHLAKHELFHLGTEYDLSYRLLQEVPVGKTPCGHVKTVDIDSQSSSPGTREENTSQRVLRDSNEGGLRSDLWKQDEEKSLLDSESKNASSLDFETAKKNHSVDSSHEDSMEKIKLFWLDFGSQVRDEFYTYPWFPNDAEMTSLHLYVYFMLDQTFGTSVLFQTQSMLDFIRLVENFHHKNPFNNFTQGVLSMHFVYVTIRNNQDFWAGLDKVALLLSSFCQHLSHPGLTSVDPYLCVHHYKVTEILAAKAGLFMKQPQLGKIVMEKVGSLMMKIQHPTNISVVQNIISAMTSSCLDWTLPEHSSWVQALLMNTSRLHFLCKPQPVCRKTLTAYFFETERQRNQCVGFDAVLRKLRDEGDVVLQFYLLTNLLPVEDGHMTHYVFKNFFQLRDREAWMSSD